MPVTTLDPKTALLVIDLQKGIVSMPTAHDVGPIIERSAALAKAFRAKGLPVALVNVVGVAPGRNERPRNTSGMPDDWAELVPELDRQPTDILASKRTWGVFATTDLGTQLKALGVTQLVLCGISTSIGVESSARQAYEAGFNVTLAVDAMTDLVAEAHQNSVERIFPRLGETGTTADIIALLAQTRG